MVGEWGALVGVIFAALALTWLSGPVLPPAPPSTCPGFPASAWLITYDSDLSDVLDVNGTRRAELLRWNFSCAGVRPATVANGSPRGGWASVIYSGSVFGVNRSFAAPFPEGAPWFVATPYAVFVTNGSDFRGPLAWLGAVGGADPRWLVAAAADGDRR